MHRRVTAEALTRCARASSLRASLRIMSLLPSATEIVGGLGLEQSLVGVSHECDLAPTAERLDALLEGGLERVTTSDIDPHATPQGEIDRLVKAALKEGGPGALYGVRRPRGDQTSWCLFVEAGRVAWLKLASRVARSRRGHRPSARSQLQRVEAGPTQGSVPAQVDGAAVARAAPTVLLTQTLCGVCAPSTDAVAAVCAASELEPTVVNLEPNDLAGVEATFHAVAAACGASGDGLASSFRDRLARVRAAAAAGRAADRAAARVVGPALRRRPLGAGAHRRRGRRAGAQRRRRRVEGYDVGRRRGGGPRRFGPRGNFPPPR